LGDRDQSPSAGSMISSRSPIFSSSPTSASNSASLHFGAQDTPKQDTEPSPSSASSPIIIYRRVAVLSSSSKRALQTEQEQTSPSATSTSLAAHGHQQSPSQRQADSPRPEVQPLNAQPTPAIVRKFRGIDELRQKREGARRGLCFTWEWEEVISEQQPQSTPPLETLSPGLSPAESRRTHKVSSEQQPTDWSEHTLTGHTTEEEDKHAREPTLPAQGSQLAPIESPPISPKLSQAHTASDGVPQGRSFSRLPKLALAVTLTVAVLAVFLSSSSLNSLSTPSLMRGLLGTGGGKEWDHPHVEGLLTIASNASAGLDASDGARMAGRLRKDFAALSFHLRQITDHPLGPDQVYVQAVSDDIETLLRLAEASETAVVRVSSLHKVLVRILNALIASTTKGLPYALSTHLDHLLDSARLAEEAMLALQQRVRDAHKDSAKTASQIATRALKSSVGLQQQNAQLYTLVLAHHLVLASLAADLGGAALSETREQQAIAHLKTQASTLGWAKDGFQMRATTEYHAMLSFHSLAAGPRAVERLRSELATLRAHTEALQLKTIQRPPLDLGVNNALAARAAALRDEHVVAGQRCELLLDGLAEEGRMVTIA
jgi:hypothetical protein